MFSTTHIGRGKPRATATLYILQNTDDKKLEMPGRPVEQGDRCDLPAGEIVRKTRHAVSARVLLAPGEPKK